MGRVYKDISGIILSGGKSSRMGENKSMMMINGKTVISRVIEMMKSIFERVIIISNEPELYKQYRIEVFTDIYRNIGPMAGVHSALLHSATEMNFIISCDIPLMNAQMIESIIQHRSNEKIVVPKADGFIQNLCGLYPKKALEKIEEIISYDLRSENRSDEQGKRQCMMTFLINSYPSLIIEDVSNLKGYFPDIFFNMNSFDDYDRMMKMHFT